MIMHNSHNVLLLMEEGAELGCKARFSDSLAPRFLFICNGLMITYNFVIHQKVIRAF